jgi:hypothetical protein
VCIALESNYKKSDFSSKAQGTIEYLVILAVMVVVGLVVVSLLANSTAPVEGVSTSTSKIVGWSNAISVTETSISPDGNYLVRLTNNTGEPLTISSVQVGDAGSNYSENLYQGSQMNFKLSSSVVCELGQTIVSSLKVTYVTENGLTKTEVYPVEIAFSCDDYIIASSADECEDCGVATVCAGDAAASDILLGKTCTIESGLLTGTYVAPTIELHSGQITSFDSGALDDAEQDGTLKSTCFTDNDDNTISDSCTGLMWQKTNSDNMTWESALEYCDGASTGEYTDWAMPSVVELVSFIDYNCFSDVNVTACSASRTGISSAFEITGYPSYWSDTTSSTTTSAYAFVWGSVLPQAKSSSLSVVCVRTES